MYAFPPKFLFLTLNEACNLRCLHCGYWRRRERLLPLPRLLELLEEMSELSPHSSVVLCGGEPMLELERYYAVCRAARRLGLRTLSVVNGTRIRNLEDAKRILLDGPSEISVSLDGWSAAMHDRLRGVQGTFAIATRAIRLLVEAKHQTGLESPCVYIMGLIHTHTYQELERFYELARDLGVDKLKTNLIQPSFGATAPDQAFVELGAMHGAELARVLHHCDQRFRLGLNPAFLVAIREYCDAIACACGREQGWDIPARTRSVICNSWTRNIMVDSSGRARLCFHGAFPSIQLREWGDLRKFWDQATWREAMSECRRVCGISHSVRAASATIPNALANSSVPDRAPLG